MRIAGKNIYDFSYLSLDTQNYYLRDSYESAWPVRPSDISIPVPELATLVLLSTGLIGFAGFRRKIKKS
jgi:hypothetical protein